MILTFVTVSFTMESLHNKNSSYHQVNSNKDNQVYNGYVRQQYAQQSESQNKHFLAPYAMPVMSNNNQSMYNIMYGSQPIYRNQNTFPMTTSINSFTQSVDPIPWVSEPCSELTKDNKLKENNSSCYSPLKNFYYNKNGLMDSHWFYSNYDNQKYSELPSCSQISTNQCCDLNDTTKSIKSVKYCSIQKYSETDSKLFYGSNDMYQQYNKITKEYSSCSQLTDIQSCNLYNNVLYAEHDKKDMANHYYSTNDINYPQNFDKLDDKATEESNGGAESDIVVEDSEEEVSDESEEVEKEESQCFVCHTSTNNCYVITSESPLTSYSQTTIYEKLSNILGITELLSNNLCNTCLNLVNTVDNLQIQLKTVQQELISKHKLTVDTLKLYVEKTEPHQKLRLKKRKFKSRDICGIHSFKCSVCEKIFSLKKFYLFHMAKHKTKTKYLCEHCGCNFVKRSSLLAHLKRHNNCDTGIKKTFVCHICGKLFKTKTNLKEHQHFCSGNLPFNCTHCERNFPSPSKLKQHFRLKHDKDFTETCSICSRGFIKKSDLKAHLITHTSDKKFKCNKCTKSYKTLSNLNHHLKIHSEKLPFTCTICLKGFLRKENLETHLNLHNGVKPFACSICNKRFANQKNLDAHLKIHNGTAVQKMCPICGKSIRHGLQDHLRTHSSVKELKCEICLMKFLTKGALAKHRKRKHDSDVDIIL